MNKIYWEKDSISAFTDSTCTEIHKHWMLQLFMCLNSEVQVNINEYIIQAHCIVIDSNIKHSIYVNNNVYYTMLIEPATDIAFNIRNQYIDKFKGYGIIDISDLEMMHFSSILSETATDEYQKFMRSFVSKIVIANNSKQILDERVEKVIKILEQCDYLDILINELAQEVNISESRLSHLFKKETKIPLKGYILMKKWKKAYKYMFEHGNITMAALEAGFDSPSHFANANKKLTGMTANFTIKNSRFLIV